MPELAVIRQALARLTDIPSSCNLAATLGFEPQEHPINFLGDTTSDIYRRVSSVAAGLYRVGSLATSTGDVGFWVADLKEWGERSTAREHLIW